MTPEEKLDADAIVLITEQMDAMLEATRRAREQGNEAAAVATLRLWHRLDHERMEWDQLEKLRRRVPMTAFLAAEGLEKVGQLGLHQKFRCAFCGADELCALDAKGIFHCFGCNEGGDVMDFMMRRHGHSFRLACLMLGRHPSIEQPYTDDELGALGRWLTRRGRAG